MDHTIVMEARQLLSHLKRFLREVQIELHRVSWPQGRETAITSSLVFAMAAMVALFFFIVDQFIGLGIHTLFHLGS